MRRWFNTLAESNRELLAREVGLAFGLFGAYYLAWRVGWTLNLDALWLSVPLLAAEVMGHIDFLLLLFMTWHVPRSKAAPAPPGRAVDVFITTYNEPVDLLRSTVLGAVNMRYPHTTYVLDDGCRPEVARLARSLGARYIARGERTHAKAGNLNHALGQTAGEFVAVFDADQVPHPQFLERTLGYFADDRIALVQTPQEFYNLDSVQHGSGEESDGHVRWHEQSLFYRVIQPGKHRLNSVFWCGSNAVLRRSALDTIGGVATETITEDIHTSLKLHAAGWRTAYHNEVLATGIAPDDLSAFLTQRKRWADGAMQVLRSKDNPLWMRGLSLPQRLSYWASLSTYFSSFQKLVFVSVPIAVLVTGTLPMRSFGWDFVAHFAPYFLLGMAANTLLARGYGHYLETERFNLLKAFTFVRASLTLLIPRQLQFRVTPKTSLVGRRAETLLAAPHTVLLALTVAAIAWAAFANDFFRTSGHRQFALELTAIWAVYNAGIIGSGVAAVLRRSHRRSWYRFPRRLPATLTIPDTVTRSFDTETVDLNSGGAGFIHEAPLPVGTQLSLTLRLPDGDDVTASGIVVNARRSERPQAFRVGVRFTELGDTDRDRLTLFLFDPSTDSLSTVTPHAAAA